MRVHSMTMTPKFINKPCSFFIKNIKYFWNKQQNLIIKKEENSSMKILLAPFKLSLLTGVGKKTESN